MSAPTLDEIRKWPATVDPAKAGSAFGIGRSYAYELVKSGEFPAKVITVGNKRRIVTASIIAALASPDKDDAA